MQKAIVLAAGRGTRMGDLTKSLPKPMLPVAGRPMLEHILERLREAGISEVLIVTGYRAEVIEQHFRAYPLTLHFRRQQEINGTAKAALLGRDFAADAPFLFTFGDIFSEPADYRGISAALMDDAGTAAAVGVKYVEDPWQGAAVYAQGGIVKRVVEKPEKGTSTTHWNSAGLWTFRPAVFDYLERVGLSSRGEYELTSGISLMLEAGERVVLYEIKGAWKDVGRPEDLAAVEQIAR